jgi:hypothetical protein
MAENPQSIDPLMPNRVHHRDDVYGGLQGICGKTLPRSGEHHRLGNPCQALGFQPLFETSRSVMRPDVAFFEGNTLPSRESDWRKQR